MADNKELNPFESEPDVNNAILTKKDDEKNETAKEQRPEAQTNDEKSTKGDQNDDQISNSNVTTEIKGDRSLADMMNLCENIVKSTETQITETQKEVPNVTVGDISSCDTLNTTQIQMKETETTESVTLTATELVTKVTETEITEQDVSISSELEERVEKVTSELEERIIESHAQEVTRDDGTKGVVTSITLDLSSTDDESQPTGVASNETSQQQNEPEVQAEEEMKATVTETTPEADMIIGKTEVTEKSAWVADFSTMNENNTLQITEEYQTVESIETKNEETKIEDDKISDTTEKRLDAEQDQPEIVETTTEEIDKDSQENKKKKIIPAMTDAEFEDMTEEQEDKMETKVEETITEAETESKFPGVMDDRTAARALKRRLLSVRRTDADGDTGVEDKTQDVETENAEEVVTVEEIISTKTEKNLVSILKKTKEDLKVEDDANQTEAKNPFGDEEEDENESITNKSDNAETSSESQDLTDGKIDELTEALVIAKATPGIVEDKFASITEPKLILQIGKTGAIKLKNPLHIVAVDNESGLIVDTQHTYVLQVSVKGELIHKYDIKHNVRSVAVFDKNLYIASKEKIYKFILGDRSAKPPSKLRPKGDIYCIATADKNTIIIIDQSKGQILEFKISDGSTTARLSGLEMPEFVSTADTPDGRCYIVSVKASNRVHVYDSDWNIHAWFDGTTFGDEPLRGVSGTAFTSATTFLLADKLNDRISEYNIDGTFIRHVLLSSNGIHLPAYLAYRDGRLWVTESEGNHKLVKLYRLPDPPKEKARRRQIPEHEPEERPEGDETVNTDDTLLIMQTNRGGAQAGTRQKNPQEIAFTNCDTVMVYDKGSSSVQELDIVGQVIREYSIKEPVTSVTTLDDTLYVASAAAIWTFNIGSNQCVATHIPKVKITNIAVPSSKLVLICNFDHGMVFEYNITTKATARKLSGLEQPRCITFGETSNGPRYLVTLWGHILSHCINVYSKDWKLLASINGEGTGFGHLFEPVGTIVTSPFTFWVAEGKKHQLSEFTFDGKFVRRVLWSKHGIHHPTSIAYTNGFVWVSECELQHGYDRVKLFKFIEPNIYPGIGMETEAAEATATENLTRKEPEKLLELNKGSHVKMKRPIQIAPALNTIVMADKDLASVQQIDRSGRVILEYSVRNTARGVAVCRDTVYIATKDTIFAFALGVKSNKPLKKFKTKVQKIFTLVVPDPSCIFVCDKHNGMIVEHKTLDDSSRVVVAGLEMPHYISVGETSEGRRYFVTLGGSFSAHCVNIYSQNWKLLGTATSRDSGDGQMRVPMGTTMNSPSTFLVADWANNRVTEFNIDGSFSRHVLWTKHGVFAPGDLAYKDGLLWVSTYPFEASKESIRLYKIEEKLESNQKKD